MTKIALRMALTALVLIVSSCDSLAGPAGQDDQPQDPSGWVISAETPHWLWGVWGTGSTIIAVGGSGTILRSTDDGRNWSLVPSGTSGGLGGVWGTQSTWIAVGEQIFRSTDDGRSWTPISVGRPVHFIALAASGSNLITVSQRSVYRSTDEGLTWTWVAELPTTTHQGIIQTPSMRSVWGSGSLFIAVGKISGAGALILRSTDGGESWMYVQSPTTRDLYGVGGSGGTILAVGEGGEVLRSTNEGVTWSLVQSGTQMEFNDVWGSGSVFRAVGWAPHIPRSTDGGLTWSLGPEATPTNMKGIWSSGSTVIAVGGDGFRGRILRSTGGL